MSWDNNEFSGKEVITPTPEYKWNNLGGLYQSFYKKYGNYSLKELRGLFRDSVENFCCWIDGLSEKELNTQWIRKWTGTNENWAMIRWTHINSVALFLKL